MSTGIKIITSAVICALVLTLLFLVVPITGTFVVSYLFALIAIGCIAGTLFFYRKGEANLVAELSYIYSAFIYAIINIIFSIIAYAIHIPVLWTTIIHIAWFAVFLIKLIASSTGSEYINKLDTSALEKRERFQSEKNSYWNK